MIDKTNLLFCGAFEGEIDLLLQNKFPALITGVGISASIFHLQKYLYETGQKPEILFCGSCGIYDAKKYALDEIAYSNRFVYKEIAEIYGLVKIPDLVQKEIKTEFSPNIGKLLNSQLKRGITNSTNSITIQDIEPEKRGLFNGLDFENMESFGLAYVAEKFGLQFTALFSITNYVGKSGSDEWRKNWRGYSDRLQQFVMAQFG